MGAWIGPISFYAAHHAKVVYALEPDPVAFAELSRNLQANPTLTNVRIFDLCIGIAEGMVRLGAKTPGDSQSSLLLADGDVVWDVRSVRLDDFIRDNGIQDPIFVKMDIEGYEYELLPTLTRVLRTRDVVLHLSTHRGIFAMARSPGRTLRSKLARRFVMLKANARLAWALRGFKYVADDRGRQISLWARALRSLFGRSLPSDRSLTIRYRRPAHVRASE